MGCNAYCNGDRHYYIDCSKNYPPEVAQSEMIGATTTIAYVRDSEPTGKLASEFEGHGMTEEQHCHLISLTDAPEAILDPEWHQHCEGEEHRPVLVGFEVCDGQPITFDLIFVEIP